jgi:hypothetical protein
MARTYREIAIEEMLGFYLPGQSREPMLLSGIALAGANREVAGDSKEGLLFVLEAEGLHLHGTELAVLSACDTAKAMSIIRKAFSASPARCARRAPAT